MKSMLILALLGCGMCWSQTSADCIPSALNIPEAKYPCVYPDNRAMFRVIAPDAQKVSVRIGRGFDMAKGSGWRVDCHHDAAGGGLPLLQPANRRSHGRRSIDDDFLRIRLAEQWNRDP